MRVQAIHRAARHMVLRTCFPPAAEEKQSVDHQSCGQDAHSCKIFLKWNPRPSSSPSYVLTPVTHLRSLSSQVVNLTSGP